MDNNTIDLAKCIAEVAALKAEVDGMKAFNQERLSNNNAIGYNESDFAVIAKGIREQIEIMESLKKK